MQRIVFRFRVRAFESAMATLNNEYLTARMGKMYMVPSNEAWLELHVSFCI